MSTSKSSGKNLPEDDWAFVDMQETVAVSKFKIIVYCSWEFLGLLV